MLHMGFICHRSAYYGLIKPLYHNKCITTVIKVIILERANPHSADRRLESSAPPKPQSESHDPSKPQ